MVVEHESLNNTKISSVNIQLQKRQKIMDDENKGKKRQKKNVPQGRPLTHPEAITVIESDDLVSTNQKFIKMPTCAKEYRAAPDKQHQERPTRPQDLMSMIKIPNEQIRETLGLPQPRRFSLYQKMQIQDELKANLKTDEVTHFSMRPPELRCVNNLKLHMTWFQRKKYTSVTDSVKATSDLKDVIYKETNKSAWIDGYNNQLFVRRKAIQPLLLHTIGCQSSCFGEGEPGRVLKKELVALLGSIEKEYRTIILKQNNLRANPTMQRQWQAHCSLYVSDRKDDFLPVVWITPVYPKRRTAFMIQLLLLFGRFETEYELMLSGSLKSAFTKAKLFDPANAEQSIDELLTLCVGDLLRTTPGSHRQFDRNLITAQSNMRAVLLNEDIAEECTPAVLHTHIIEETDHKTQQHCDKEKERFILRLHDDLTAIGFGNVIPTKERLMFARQLPLNDEQRNQFFPPPMQSCLQKQSKASFIEQKNVLLKAKHQIDLHRSHGKKHFNVVISGGPGVGKTTVSQLISLYLLSCGYNVTATSLVAQRSKELGGKHYHRLFGCNSTGDNASPGRFAEKTIASLYRRPGQLQYLKTLDALLVDELGLFSAEMFAVMDIILRYIRNCKSYMGGLFVCGAIDVRQLMTFKGTPFLMSTHILTDYTFVELTQSVRATNDPSLRRIMQLTRTVNWTTAKKKEFKQLIIDNCNFVESFNDPTIPNDAVYVFGKKSPCYEAEKLMLERMKSVHGDKCVVSWSADEESTTAGNWSDAKPPTSARLSKLVKTKKQLLFYPKAFFEFTYNDEKNNFLQGQLALMLDVPTVEQVAANEQVHVFASPLGCKDFPPLDEQNTQQLVQLNWKRVSVPFAASRPQTVFKGLQARRSQYGLKPRVASTIHAGMGSTMNAVVTCLADTQNGSVDNSLWDAAQVVVLLSRTRRSKDIFFVGDKDQTVNNLLTALEQPNKLLCYVSKLLSQITNEDTETPVFQQPSLYIPRDSVVPKTSCVYLLISTKQTAYCYIGATKNLRKRLDQHNSGQGARTTRNPALRPWGVMAYVDGFVSSSTRLSFESCWKTRFQTLPLRIGQNYFRLLQTARLLIEENSRNNNKTFDAQLRLIETGRVLLPNGNVETNNDDNTNDELHDNNNENNNNNV